MNQEALYQIAGPRTQTEIFLDNIPYTDNVVYESRSSPQQLQSDKSEEWTQVFDLDDAALIVWVENDLLLMKLLHFTDQPLKQYYGLIQRNVLSMPTEMSTGNFGFLKTENDEKNQLKQIFEKYSTAKLRVDGRIVQNLALTDSVKLNSSYRRVGGEIDLQRKTLSFVTTSNVLYQVDFDRYYLKNKESLYVKVMELTEITGQVRAFDVCYDYTNNQSVLAVGSSIIVKDFDKNDSIKDAQELALTFVKADPTNVNDLVYHQVRHEDLFSTSSSYLGFVKVLKKGISNIVNRTQQQFIGSNKRVLTTVIRQTGRVGFEEGIVSIKSLTNCLIAVVYTSGILKIWSVVTGQCLSYYDLFEQGEDEMNKSKQNKRVINAKMQSLTYRMHIETQSKSLKLVIAYEETSMLDYNCHWIVDQFNLNFQNLSADQFDRTNEDFLDLSNQDLEMIHHFQTFIDEEAKVKDIILESSNRTSHLWLVTHSQTEGSKITDMLEPVEQVWSRNLQQQYYQLFDEMDLPHELKINNDSPYKKQIQEHYHKRLSLPGRFSDMSFRNVFEQKGISADYLKRTPVLTILENVCSRYNYLELEGIRQSLIKIEQYNSQIYGISPQFRDLPFRLVLRPIGISLLKTDSLYASLVQRSNALTGEIAKVLTYENSYQSSTQPSKFDNNISGKDPLSLLELVTTHQDNPILLLISAMQLLHLQSLPAIDQFIMEGNNQLDLQDLIIQVFRESCQYEALNNEILRVINSQRMTIEQNLNQLIDQLVLQLLEQNASDGRSTNKMRGYDPIDENNYHLNVLKIIERGVQSELQALQQLIRDLFILKIFIQETKAILNMNGNVIESDNKRLESLSFWLTQITSLNQILAQTIEYKIMKQNSFSKMSVLDRILATGVIQNSQQVPISLILLLSIPDTYLHSPLSNTFNQFDISIKQYGADGTQQHAIVEHRMAMFANILVRFLQKYSFKENISDETYVPSIVRKLYLLRQYNLISKYLAPLNEFSTIALEFLRALLAANTNQPSQYLEHMYICLARFHQSLANNVQLKVFSLVLNKREIVEVRNNMNAANQNNIVVQFYLALIFQLKNLDEKYSLFLISSALLEDQIIQLSFEDSQVNMSEKDYFYDLMYKTASIQRSADYLYQACTQIQNLQRKRVILGSFIEVAIQSPNSQYLLCTQYYFTQDEIDMAFDYLMSRANSYLTTDTRGQLTVTYMDAKRNIMNLIRALNIITQIYDRHIEFSRYLWSLSQSIDVVISSISCDFATDYIELLELNWTILAIIYQNAKYCGEHFFITKEEGIIEGKNSVSNSIASSNRQSSALYQQDDGHKIDLGNQYQECDDLIKDYGHSVLYVLDQQRKKFRSGNMTLLKKQDLLNQMILIEVKIKCGQLDCLDTSDLELLYEYLIEKNEYHLATKFALAFKLSACLPIALIIRDVSIEKVQQSPLQWNECIENDQPVITAKQLPREDGQFVDLFEIQVQTARYALTIHQLIEVAQNLKRLDHRIPHCIQDLIVDQGLIIVLVKLYLAKIKEDDVQHVFTVMRKYHERAITDLTSCDINFLAMIIQNTNEALDANVQHLAYLEQNKASLQVHIDQQRKNEPQRIRISNKKMLEDLERFINVRQVHQNRIKHKLQKTELVKEQLDLEKEIQETQQIINHCSMLLVEFKTILDLTLKKL
ncbi:UNKNOWN [Stylonychia lemnae]|uniref:Uncharacterized protein n=1 Tax=Stylonychia lemnae TaxID=5949 RepID=A0A078B9F1_STYLE|nr:UNKNOWN [Stylonychia lemnae]|eukprot:CDW91029.1 UNKNOWN [Stylonychia lemnae]